LIDIVSRVVSADEAALGWDPTIIRGFDDGGKPYYDIVVHDKTSGEKTYRTSKILFSYGADPLRGRGTRVFEGRLLEDGMPSGHSVAIKDGWVDHDRKREATILADLYAEADEADKLLIEQHFLTVLAYGDVIVSGQIDHTRDLIMRGKDVPTSSQFLLTNLPPLRSTRGLSTLTYDDSALTRAQRATYRFSDKVHNRTVYKEVAAPIYTVKGLAVSFQVLQDTTIGGAYVTSICCSH
jgi:Fungal protein kinase